MAESELLKPSQAQRVAVALVAIVLVLTAVGAGLALAFYVAGPESYRFGTEVAGFRFRSEAHFVWTNLAQGVLAVLSLLLGTRLWTTRVSAENRTVVAVASTVGTLCTLFL